MSCNVTIMAIVTLCYRKILKYTIDEYDHFLFFLAAESEFDIRFSLSRLDFAVQEVDIFAFLNWKKILKYTIDECDHFLCILASESESDISFAPSHLDFAACEVTIFGKQ